MYMETIKSIDLWTEQYENQYECFNGALLMVLKMVKLLLMNIK